MGTCATKEQHRSLDRLNEFDPKDFARSDARIFVGSRRGRWKRTKAMNGTLSPRIEDDASEDIPALLTAQPWTLSSSEGEPSPSAQDAVEAPPEKFAMARTTPSSLSSGFLAVSTSTSSSGARPVETMTKDGQSNAWRVSRHGHALQLRLAKHRFLQMAVTTQSSPETPTDTPLSPVTMDSTFGVKPSPQNSGLTDRTLLSSGFTEPSILKSETELLDGESTLYCDEPSVDFDAIQAIIWKEIPQDHNVTALAMSQTMNSSPSVDADPLMIAMGDEIGNVVVSNIIDEAFSSRNLSEDTSRPDSQLDLLPSQALKFCIDERVRSLDFAKGGHLAVGGDGCTVWILEIIFDGARKRRLKDLVTIHKVHRIDRVYAVRFSPDHRYLAIGGFDGKTALMPMEDIWKEDKLEKRTDYRNDDDSLLDDSLIEILDSSIIELDMSGLIYCLDWSPAEDYLAVAGSNKSCAIYETKGFNLVHETASTLTAIQTVQWNQNGTFLAIGGREVAIIEGQPPFKVHCEINHTPTDSTINEFRYRITSLCWSPSGSYLAIGGTDGICLVVETKGYTLVHEVHRTQSITALAWGQQSNLNGDMRRYLALSDEDFNVALVKAGAEARAYEPADDLSSVDSSSHFRSSSEWVLREDTFRDLEDVEPHKQQSALKPQDKNVTAVAFSKKSGKSKTSSYLAFACDDCSLTITTTRDWKTVFEIEFANPIRSLDFSNSNNYLALGGDEGVLYILSVPSRSMILHKILPTPIQSLAFSTLDERLSIGTNDGVLSLLCPDADWELVGEIENNESSILCQDWTTKALAVGRKDGSVTLFDAEKAFCNFFVPVAEFTSSLPVRSVAFSVGGRFLAIGGDNGVVSILSGKGGWILCNQINLKCNVFSIRWSPAGRYVAFAGSDKVLFVHDTITWVALNEVKETHSSIFVENVDSVSCIDWSVDSKWLAIGAFGSGLHVMSTSNWKLLVPSANGLNSDGGDERPRAARRTYE